MSGDLSIGVLALWRAVADDLRGHGHCSPGRCLALGVLQVELSSVTFMAVAQRWSSLTARPGHSAAGCSRRYRRRSWHRARRGTSS